MPWSVRHPDEIFDSAISAGFPTPASMVAPIVVPANAVLSNAAGTQVVVIDDHNVADHHRVVVGRDYGATVEILSGVNECATVALNPSDEIRDGRVVRPVRASPAS